MNVILNLAKVSGIDADGLEALVFCYAQIRKRGGALKVLHLNIEHLNLSALTKLNTLFEVFVDEHDAINSFFPGSAVLHYDVLEWVIEHQQSAWVVISGFVVPMIKAEPLWQLRHRSIIGDDGS